MTVKLDTSGADEIIKNIEKRKTKCGRKIAFWIEGKTKANAPVRTSALKNSVYVKTKDEDHYGDASSAVEGANPGAQTEAHPAVEGNTVAIVGPCVEYAEYVEFGTSRQAANPYFSNALHDAEKEFEAPATWEDLWQ